MNNKVIFIFLDGVGVAEENENNPFSFCTMDFLHGITGGRLCSGRVVESGNVVFKGIDACLGVKGIPQSATGQTALFTGTNAPGILGYHFPAFPNEELKSMIRERNLYFDVAALGKSATFANAYGPRYFKFVEEGKRQHSVTTVSLLAAKLKVRTLDDLRAGKAVYWDMTNAYLKERAGEYVAEISPFDAGRNLARISEENSLVVFECFLPDLIGHRRSLENALSFCSGLDEFLRGVHEVMPDDATILITSDHGNMEDLSTAGHTTNPSMLVAIGSRAEAFADVDAITGIKDAIIRIIGE